MDVHLPSSLWSSSGELGGLPGSGGSKSARPDGRPSKDRVSDQKTVLLVEDNDDNRIVA